jgi:tetratricopeptide (TPR) repeat protein
MRFSFAAGIAVATCIAGVACADAVSDAKAGQDALNRNDNAGAVALFSRAIDSHGLSQDGQESAYVERATAFMAMRQFDLALADLDLAQSISPDDPDAKTMRAKIPPTATLDQTSAARRGATLYGRGDYDGALAALNRAIDLKPRDDYSLYERGLTWLAKPDYDRALADFKAVMQIKPTWGTLEERGNAWRGRGNYAQAIADYNNALQMNSSAAAVYFDRGQAYALQRDSSSAINDFNRALQLAPNVEAYLYARCEIRSAASVDLDRALADCDKTLQINPDSAADFDARAFAHFKRGEFDLAIGDANEALRRDARRASALFVRGLAETRSGKGNGAADIRTAQSMDPHVGDYYAKWGVRF